MKNESVTLDDNKTSRLPVDAAREVTDAVRADLISSTVDVVLGRAMIVTDEDGIIEVDAPHMQIVTWRGNHAEVSIARLVARGE